MPASSTPAVGTSVAQTIADCCAVVPDYPREGIVFRDLTPLFADGAAFRQSIDALVEEFRGCFDLVAGVEARGFLLAAAVAYAAGVGCLPVRKKGKLPRETYEAAYELEYGSAAVEIHRDDVAPGARVLVLDDVLATGGTLAATADLMAQAGLEVAGIGVLMELDGLGGRENLAEHSVRALYTV